MVLTFVSFMLLLMSVQTAGSSSLVTLKCESVSVVVSQSAEIKCNVSIEAVNNTFKLYRATLCRDGAGKNKIFEYKESENANDSYRFQRLNKSEVSLTLPVTTAFDDGEYQYQIVTDRGEAGANFKIHVSAKYHNPVISSEQRKVTDDGGTELYCNATAGYPAGTIQWFDPSGNNLTRNATLQVTRGNDGLFNLYSKLSSRSKTEYMCVVLNSRYEPEESIRWGFSKGEPEEVKVRYTAAGVFMVFGILIAGLLVFFIFTVRRRQQKLRRASMTPILGQFRDDHRDVETEALQ